MISEFDKGSKFHFIGIGGIGMSGLAQMLRESGMEVSGSDRGLGAPENSKIFDSLKSRGIRLFPQDGSFIKDFKPDFIVYSTAIEEDNPDFIAGKNIPKLHRSETLAAAMSRKSEKKLVAVTGSAGKTSVSAWLAETLFLCGHDPEFLGGGLSNRFSSENYAGNYRPGNGKYFVFEADESDKSLTAYSPDYAVILNIGTDHYSKEELVKVFGQFLKKTKRGALLGKDAYDLLKDFIPSHLDVKIFSSSGQDTDWYFSYLHSEKDRIKTVINGKYEIFLPAPGLHVAANAAAVMAFFDLTGLSIENAAEKLQDFKGVWRRFDYAGRFKGRGSRVYDDYAHNVEKILSCLKAAGEISKGKVITVFQPHGFGPLGFMKNELLRAITPELEGGNIFLMMPVFYAGGTTSFKPTSEEVVKEWQTKGALNCFSPTSRDEAEKFLKENSSPEDIILVTGARDNSLSDWAKELCN